MKKLICATAALVALSASAAFANDTAATPRAATPVVLDDAQLDSTTGGLISVLNGVLNGNKVLSGNSGLVNANVNAPINVSNIALLSSAKQSSHNNQGSGQSIKSSVSRR